MRNGFTNSNDRSNCRPAFTRLWLLWLLFIIAGCAREADTSAVTEVTRFDALRSKSLVPPPATSAWQPFELPLGTRYADAANSDAVYWFRAQLTRPSGEALQGLYLFRYTKSVDVWFNGDYLGGDIHKPGRDTAAWNHPLLLPIQNANWHDGNDNEVLIRLQASRLGGVFAGALAGDYRQLQALHAQRHFRQITVNEWLLSFGVLVTLLALLLWFLRRQESLYWQFALMSTGWLLITYHMVAYQLPLPDRWWLPLVHVGIDGWIYAVSLFLANWFELERPRQLRWQRYLLAVATLWHALALLPYWWMTAYLFHAVGLGFIIVLLYHGVQRRLASGGRLSILAAVMVIQVSCVLHDFYALVLVPVPDWQTAYHWSQFAFPLVQAVFLVMLILRFVGALTVAEGMNQQLEARVTTIRRQLEDVYAKARQAELQKAAEEERSRIYRDLHDDVGSKLLSIAHAGRETRLGSLASSALESLREAVARVNNPEIPFSDFLHELKEEMTLRLASLGIALLWWQPEHDLDWQLSSSQNYHLSRLFRELVSNIIRHAAANEVEFSVQRAGNRWLFVLADNGCGFDTLQASGTGMRNLRIRAAELGAELGWNSGANGGVQVTLLLPQERGTRLNPHAGSLSPP